MPTAEGAASRSAAISAGSYVPNPGSWVRGVKIERVAHAFDLPGSDNQLLLCAGSGNDLERARKRTFTCYRYDRNAGTFTVMHTPTDWFCNAAVHMHNGRILIAGGTGIDGYPAVNGGHWEGARETYTYAPTTGQVRRIGNAAASSYPGLLEDQEGGVYKYGGSHNGVSLRTWEYLPRGKDT